MTDRRSHRDTAHSDEDEPPNAGAPAGHGTPRWVKVFGVIALVLLVMLLVALLSGGKHGPGRHFGDLGRQPAATRVPAVLVPQLRRRPGGRSRS